MRPAAQRGRAAMTMIAQWAEAGDPAAARDPAALQAVMRQAVASVDPQQAISYFYTLDFLRERAMGGLRLVAVGLLLGLAGAMAASRAIRSLLVDVPAFDAGIYLAAAGLFGAVALVACLVPALRASRVDPIVALRNE